MNRREFNAVAIAAALVPSWFTAQKRVPKIDLSLFVADGPFSRWGIQAPFHQDGLTYATDARICVRTRLIVPVAADKEARLPPASKLPCWNPPSDLWQPWPKQSYVRGEDRKGICPMCYGRGRTGIGVVLCAKCEGEGQLYDYDEIGEPINSAMCEKCCEAGYTGGDRCDYCNGKGMTDRPRLMLLGDAVLCGQFDQKIRTLQDVEWQAYDEHCIRFRFDGGEGAVMTVLENPQPGQPKGAK